MNHEINLSERMLMNILFKRKIKVIIVQNHSLKKFFFTFLFNNFRFCIYSLRIAVIFIENK